MKLSSRKKNFASCMSWNISKRLKYLNENRSQEVDAFKRFFLQKKFKKNFFKQNKKSCTCLESLSQYFINSICSAMRSAIFTLTFHLALIKMNIRFFLFFFFFVDICYKFYITIFDFSHTKLFNAVRRSSHEMWISVFHLLSLFM